MAGQRDEKDFAPRFAADRMLGRLARWLRLTGCDVIYGRHLSGRGLLCAARREGRTLLTRDRRLLRKAPLPPFLFIPSDDFREQLRQVLSAFRIDPHARLLERCVACNGRLSEVAPGALPPGSLPDFVARTHGAVHVCDDCRHVTWEATHVGRIRDELRRIGFPGPGRGESEK